MVHSVLMGNGLLVKLSIHVANTDSNQPLWFVKKIRVPLHLYLPFSLKGPIRMLYALEDVIGGTTYTIYQV